ncbi:monovalent cation/H(+) antiporter subunit G [Sphingobacterium psychroaquaticum]|uniref:Multisubunit sodium/proton antiporter, MrpG subunit n=1 Tax=Sphingobacterium psychroaquaticum TaxID=561061 RepID=A0A1X7L6S0_9SPHI|nr:monovalent cation/H(+) antiporter subunit G [Sphingobacterium psychroaquaticum]QBQ42334.1 monovalent cation/H(+) antiporter subunit G [Sphingobacterium psychroaquaticum]SMG49470.1 multisubunit sodium/proton antiporter, MrpG subunit [Sphingobacterium psychroaquaticum]
MIKIILALLSTGGALSILFASIGILRMPDFYLRLSVTVKASTLGVGLLLICAAIMFPDVSVTTKAIAIIFFLIITAPIAAHMIGRAAYFTGTPLWKGTVVDELAGMYNKETHELENHPDEGTDERGNIAETSKETK